MNPMAGRTAGGRPSIGSSALPRAAESLIRWVDDHLERFCPATAVQGNRSENAKRTAELSIVLLGISRSPRQWPVGDAYAEWARDCAIRMSRMLRRQEPPVERVGNAPASNSRYSRSLLLTRAALQTAISGAALPGPAPGIHRPAGRPERALAEGGGLPERRPHLLEREPDPESAYVRDVMGLADCRPAIRAHLLSAVPAARAGSSVQETYDLTHLVFFATDMGRRDPGWAAPETRLARLGLQQAGWAALERHDFDLMAESALALLHLRGRPPSPLIGEVAGRLAAAAQRRGSLPPHPRHAGEAGDAFGDDYHPTLVGLAALVETARTRTVTR